MPNLNLVMLLEITDCLQPPFIAELRPQLGAALQALNGDHNDEEHLDGLTDWETLGSNELGNLGARMRTLHLLHVQMEKIADEHAEAIRSLHANLEIMGGKKRFKIVSGA